MANMRFMYNNLFDATATTVTALTTNADFPLANLKNIWKTKHHRTMDHDDQWWKWDIGAAYGAIGLKAAIFLYHNFSATATIGLYAHDTDLGDNPATWIAHGDTLKVPLVYGVDWNADLLCKYWPTLQVYRWWFLSVDDGANGDGYLRLGRPFGGAYDTPTHDYRTYSETPIDPSTVVYSIGSQPNITERESYRLFGFSIDGLPDTERDTYLSIYRTYVKKSPFFICRDPANSLTTTYYVESTKDWGFDRAGKNNNTLILELKESI